MKNFIELTSKIDLTLVNLDQVIYIEKNDDGTATLFFNNIINPEEKFEQKNHMRVMESYDWLVYTLAGDSFNPTKKAPSKYPD